MDHINSIKEKELKRSKTCLCFNVGKHKIKSRNRNLNLKENNKTNRLCNINNKSCSCITPGSFNPLINYKIEDKEKNKYKYKIKNYRNKDHFFHMNPTEIYKYKPQLKRTKYNYSYSQIVGLPGSQKNNGINLKEKKSGKKIFFLKNKESKDDRSRNQKKFICLNNISNINTIYNKLENKMKTYEYEAPIITYKNIDNFKKPIN